MSVYIKIKKASLNRRPSSPIYLLIQSQSAVLKTVETPSSKSPFFQSSLICSVRQRYLYFRLCQNPFKSGLHIPSMTTLGQSGHKVIAVGHLPFHYFEQEPGIEVVRILELAAEGQNNYKNQGHLQISIYYQPSKNYIGEMQFYEFGESQLAKMQSNKNIINTNTSILGQLNNNKNKFNSFPVISTPNKYINGSPQSYFSNSAGKSSQKSRICNIGPSKNIFNCCDRPVNEQEHQYQFIQPHYFGN